MAISAPALADALIGELSPKAPQSSITARQKSNKYFLRIVGNLMDEFSRFIY